MEQVTFVENYVEENLKEDEKYRETYTSLARRHNALISACKGVENQNYKLRDAAEVLEKKLLEAGQQVDINKKIVMNALTEQNLMKEKLYAEIAVLKGEVQRLKNDDND
ncbi:MAG: hypothetical protein KAX49_19160 [Halanaerobiales bacterium]|nr:hypothetical protein [Halanaerobiales bacterium]